MVSLERSVVCVSANVVLGKTATPVAPSSSDRTISTLLAAWLPVM